MYIVDIDTPPLSQHTHSQLVVHVTVQLLTLSNLLTSSTNGSNISSTPYLSMKAVRTTATSWIAASYDRSLGSRLPSV